MFDRLKKALVTSFVGTIALGWLFAQAILHFANIFSAPITGWLMRREYSGLVEHSTAIGFSLQDSVPELVKCVLLLLIGYLLLRWLYFTPVKQERTLDAEQTPANP